MSSHVPGRRSLESLRKEAKRWLRALQGGDADALLRFRRHGGHDRDIAQVTLRDIQFALARELGFAGWAELVANSNTPSPEAAERIAYYDRAVDALLDAYRTGTAEAMERHYSFTWHRRAWDGMRRYVQADLGLDVAHTTTAANDERSADVDITVADAQYLVARDHGFNSWDALQSDVAFTSPSVGRTLPLAAKPVGVSLHVGDSETVLIRSRDWEEVCDVLDAHPDATLHAHGQLTDDVLERISAIEGLHRLDFGGSRQVTSRGFRHVQQLRELRQLNVSSTTIDDDALRMVEGLPHLQHIDLSDTAITDAGARLLGSCTALTNVSLLWTNTGNDALAALRGLPHLGHVGTGARVTDEGLGLLHEFPVFAEWRGGVERMELTSDQVSPNLLIVRANISDRGIESLRGLDGLFGLDIDDARMPLSARSMQSVATLPRLAWLGADAKDDWMVHIARMPHLRFLVAQDTSATDEGFEALGSSQTLEYFWGRRCHGLGARGFVALSRMPKLRALSASMLNVSDGALALLPQFPALRELMPMDVPDEGYRHIAHCSELKSLVLMYCRHTTDAATEHIARLRKLERYYNSYTRITDRTPELLAGIDTLERVEFDGCHRLTDAGISALARLPRLREVRVSGRGVTQAATRAFGGNVKVAINE